MKRLIDKLTRRQPAQAKDQQGTAGRDPALTSLGVSREDHIAAILRATGRLPTLCLRCGEPIDINDPENELIGAAVQHPVWTCISLLRGKIIQLEMERDQG